MNDVFQKDKFKIFNDSVHGNIEIHPLCVKIIDTPQFQRLRQIKQLGAAHYVYPGAVHTRFEHSIGTCFLAEKWVKKLISTLRDDVRKHISDKDILCVMIAGLCHDLGQGPYSIFDRYVELKKAATDETKLEKRSEDMFNYMIEEKMADGKSLRKVMQENYGLSTDNIADIKLMMKGVVRRESTIPKQARQFLFEIVKNQHTSVDVATWESLARDCRHLNITNSFDYKRLIKFSRINLDKNSCTQICFRDKEIENIYKMFEMGYDLHRQAYSHRVTSTVNLMICDALDKANGHIEIPGQNGDIKSLADCPTDMSAFTKLTDNIICLVTLSGDNSALEESRTILSNIERRHLYPSYRTKPITFPSDRALMEKINEKAAKAEICRLANKEEVLIKETEILIEFIRLAYTKDYVDPASKLHYYKKENPTEISNDSSFQSIRLKPKDFHQHVIVVYCRDMKAQTGKRNALEEALKEWCDDAGLNWNYS